MKRVARELRKQLKFRKKKKEEEEGKNKRGFRELANTYSMKLNNSRG
jgi:hypothetical protein